MIRKLSRAFLKGIGIMLAKLGDRIGLFAEDVLYDRPSGSKKELKKNIVYANKHKGKRAFVIANGPSIQKQDLSLLKDELTFTMSGIWKHPLIDEGWQPTYYCLADPLFFQEREGFDSVKEFFLDLRTKITESHFFMPLFAKKIIEKYNLLNVRKINYVLFKSSLKDARDKKINPTKALPGVQSVAQMGIELAMYMGCSPIYLLGFDHDWLAKRGMDRHFYQGKTLKNHPKAHGDLDKFSYKEDLRACLTLWEGYGALLKIAKAKNVQIVNATEGGFLDVFPRQNYKDIIKGENDKLKGDK